MFIIGIVGHGSLSILLVQMLIEHNGFDFESIESFNFFVFGYGIW